MVRAGRIGGALRCGGNITGRGSGCFGSYVLDSNMDLGNRG